MTRIPNSWSTVPITDVLTPNENGKPFQQGWSPQCEPHPAAEGRWGVLKTTAIQPDLFWDHQNKELPENLEPRPNIEVMPGDLLMTCAGPRSRCGVVCLVERTRPRLMMSGKMYRFRPNRKVMHPRYLAYFIQSREAQIAIDLMKTGISDSGLNLTHDRFAALQVPVAPPPEQRRIVAKLEELFSELDKGVESLATAREQLKVYRQAALKHAFEGKLTGDWRANNRDAEIGAMLRQRVLETRKNEWEKAEKARLELQGRPLADDSWKVRYPEPDAFDSDGLPDLPRQWCWAGFDELASGKPRSMQSGPFGSNLKHSEFQASGVLVVGIDNVRDGAFSMGSQNRISQKKFQELEKYQARPGDLLVTVMASLGRTCIVPRDLEKAIITKHVYRISMEEDLVYPEYFNLLLQSQTVTRLRMFENAQGQTRPGLNSSILKTLPIPLCCRTEQVEIVSRLSSQLSRVDDALSQIGDQLSRATALRYSILKNAFSGRLIAQDQNDEATSILLGRIKAERETNGNRRKKNTGAKEAA